MVVSIAEKPSVIEGRALSLISGQGNFTPSLICSVLVDFVAGTQRFLQRLELYASVVMGLEAPALVNGQNLAITYNVFLGNHIEH
ncbi:hypothetical protein JHK85_009898 [Glycine max]|nr:hypothetical protein JHK85_009898 [Glycine max]